MPLFLEIAIAFITIIISFAVIVAAMGYYKQGKNTRSMDNDSIYKGRIEALELQVKSQSTDLLKLTQEVIKLRADNEEANRKLIEAMNIIKDRSPEMQEFIANSKQFRGTMLGYVQEAKPFLESLKMEVVPVVKKLDKFLDGQVLK